MSDRFRSKEWAPLTGEQKENIKVIKGMAEDIDAFAQVNVAPSRLRSIAETNLETAIMYYVKAITE